MNDEQRQMARNALGLQYSEQSYRNRFLAGAGSRECKQWEALVDMGFAELLDVKSINKDFRYFILTPEGARHVLKRGEALCPEDFPNQPKQGE